MVPLAEMAMARHEWSQAETFATDDPDTEEGWQLVAYHLGRARDRANTILVEG